jgi:hypothetical protein
MSRDVLDADPFAEWLHSHVRRFGREEVRARLQCGGEAIADLLALVPGDTIALKTVDRCLIRMDTGDSLATLYPELDGRLPSGRRKPSHAGFPITVSEDVLLEAHRLHIDEGYSLRKLGRALHHRTTSKSPEALSRTLHNAFQQRGWETIGRGEAIARFNRAKVDHLPFCTHVHRIGLKTGQRCSKRTSSGTCWHHDPQRLVELEQRLRPVAA